MVMQLTQSNDWAWLWPFTLACELERRWNRDWWDKKKWHLQGGIGVLKSFAGVYIWAFRGREKKDWTEPGKNQREKERTTGVFSLTFLHTSCKR
ncbi:hypothetical protein AVEN_6835-1 [Araneus ventricosus]|uniref:Uncharacterized protein n=1 Tax=Araneus ventricosus TaxID=182803 RepID=A0A4Y2R2D0_ARAVE|nr:hypothetical protein AVEN_6835-1 [Araneus ventricosus]